MINDTYKTIKNTSEGVYREKGSKFLAVAIPVETEEAVKEKLVELQKMHHSARHHCYAYILGFDKSSYRLNDDGEPSGTAGKPIYGQLLSKDITNVLVVVIRYFGGTKLGVSGLITAYKTATKSALENNEIIEKQIEAQYCISFDPIEMEQVMKILKGNDISILQHYFQEQQMIDFKVRKKKEQHILSMLAQIEGLSYTKLPV